MQKSARALKLWAFVCLCTPCKKGKCAKKMQNRRVLRAFECVKIAFFEKNAKIF